MNPLTQLLNMYLNLRAIYKTVYFIPFTPNTLPVYIKIINLKSPAFCVFRCKEGAGIIPITILTH